MKPLVSIIIPTRNNESTMGLCLSSLANQTYKNIEIIIVDAYSTDATRKIARKYTKKVFNKRSERNPARNYGAKKSRGKFLLIIDSDMELTPTVIEDCAKKMKKDVAALMIPEISIGEGFWAGCKGLEKIVSTNDDNLEAVRFFRKDVFLKSGGYDENMVAGEDWDLSQRIKKSGLKISRIKSPINHHEGSPGLLKLMRKKYYYGKSIRLFIKKHPKVSRTQFIPIRPAFIRNWKTVIRHPLLGSGLIFMKFCEFGAGGCGLVAAKIKRGREV